MNSMIITFIILILTVAMMVWEKIPLALTALCTSLLLILTGVLTPAEGFSGFSNSNVILITGMVVIGHAFFTTGVAQDIGFAVLKYAKSETALIALIIMVTGLMSGMLSNTGVTAVMLPIVLGICYKSKINRSRLVMPISIAAGCGGTITLVGTVVNVIANTTLEEFGYEERFGFFEFTKVGLPLLIITTIFMATVGKKLLPNRPYISTEGETDQDQHQDFSHVPKWKKYLTLAVLILTFFGMVFEEQIGIDLHVTAVIGAVVLVLTGVLSENEAYKAIDLRTAFLLAGILPLAAALEKTGAGEAIANQVVNLFGDNTSPFMLMMVLYLMSCIMTQFMSNTATAALLCPIGLSIAQGLNVSPKAVLIAIVLGASFAYATPLGMPANTMVMAPGGYKFIDYTKVGVPLLIISFIFCMIVIPIFWPMT
ncbi:MAG: SLC13 family permease [Lachnospiraceae bacterium]